jgi:hypothetical protein
MCVAEWSWGFKSKPFVCSSLKPAYKSRQDEMCYTFDMFDYLLQEKQIKLPSGHVIPLSEQVKKHVYCKWHNSYSHATNDCNVFRRQVQLAINEGRLKFTESPQMKLDKDPFPANMNMVDLDGKKVMVRPSQSESTKGKEVVIGEERPPRMMKPKSPKDGQWQKNEGAGRNDAQRPPSTSSWSSTRKAGAASGVAKTRPSGMPNRTIWFP